MKITWVEPAVLAASSIPVDIKDLRSLREQVRRCRPQSTLLSDAQRAFLSEFASSARER